ncbi:MAG: enoyl-CoA hydratase/isomerase family protein [Deltaproteobacteria bacterium]|nr:enoyl-CoA hydratase/isomerase family protein [Deltaproteobacteria bacterium]
MTFETLKVDVAERVAEITIVRPKALNALNRQVVAELEAALEKLRALPALACVILTGQGEKAFIAGADIAEMSGMAPSAALEFARAGHRVLGLLESFPVPVLAAVNGFALGGGCEVALACDVVYASDNAKFGQPEVKLGLIPGFGGCVRLPRKIGLGAAAEWIFTGEIYNAVAAKEVGLVREVVPQAELLPKVRGIAKLIAMRAPLAVRAAKKAMVAGLSTNPEAAATIEQLSFGQMFNSKDAREGTKAFLDKRDPQFTGD